jgi:hypothetical protein
MEPDGRGSGEGPEVSPAPDSEPMVEVADESGKEPALTDAEFALKARMLDLENRETEVERLKTEVDKLKEELHTEKENRSLRHGVAIAALIVMCVQVLASNAIFVWYGDTNGWEISAAAISAWMGTTVVEVVSVVLVIVNYLFPNSKRNDG